MFLGNLLALLQDNPQTPSRLLQRGARRLHAYRAGSGLLTSEPRRSASKASPSGTGVEGGVETMLFYLVAYGAMTVGAFAVLAYLSTPQRPVETLDDLAGLSRSHPGVALLMLLFLFSLIGISLDGGFCRQVHALFRSDGGGIAQACPFVSGAGFAWGY